jgi:hypothetical protein
LANAISAAGTLFDVLRREHEQILCDIGQSMAFADDIIDGRYLCAHTEG